MDLQKIWLPAQDLYNIKEVNILALRVEGGIRTYPCLRAIDR